MKMDGIIKILEQLKDLFSFFYVKPWHFLFIGISFLIVHFFYFSSRKLFTIGLTLIVFSILTLVETKYRNIQFEDQIKNYYGSLQRKEKEIIQYCLDNETVTYRTSPMDDDSYTDAIYSLVSKNFGRNISFGGDFVMYNEVFKLLKKLEKREIK